METNAELLQKLDEYKEAVVSASRPLPRFESDELGQLFAALAKAQADMEMAKPDSANPFFKSRYADLGSVVKASRPCLSKNGLSVIHRILPNGNGNQYLYSRLCHASGEWIESKALVNPPKEDMQSFGSYLTYLRRYTYCALTGVVSSDEDDDGERVAQSQRRQEPAGGGDRITRTEATLLSDELEGNEALLESLLKNKGISKLSDLPKSEFQKTLGRIRKVKESMEV